MTKILETISKNKNYEDCIVEIAFQVMFNEENLNGTVCSEMGFYVSTNYNVLGSVIIEDVEKLLALESHSKYIKFVYTNQITKERFPAKGFIERSYSSRFKEQYKKCWLFRLYNGGWYKIDKMEEKELEHLYLIYNDK